MSTSTEATTEDVDVDVAIIGLGSAGEALATGLTDAGMSVVGFDPGLIGGECPFTACMPSKALLHHAATLDPDWPTARDHRDEVVNHLDDQGHHDELVDAGVEVVRSRARLIGPYEVEADGRRWRARTVVLATGSDPVIPPIDGVDSARAWTSEEFMTATELPESLVIVGGGAIGCETAAIMAGFGRRTCLIESDEALLAGNVDPVVSGLLADRLRDLGVDLHLDADVERVAHGDGEDTVTLADGKTLTGARVLFATGQAPNWEGLGLETVGLDDEPEVDDEYRVGGTEWLRAIGDVDGRSPWTHGANHEAARLVEVLTGHDVRSEIEAMANCVFTDPPVGAVGHTAASAAEAGLDVVSGMAQYSDIARFSTDQLFDGAVVIIAERGTGRIVGASGIGAHFDDVISIVTALMAGGVSARGASRMVIPFPTMAQVLTPAFDEARRSSS